MTDHTAIELPTAADDAKLSIQQHIDRLRFNLIMGLDAHPIGRSVTWLLHEYDRLLAELAETAPPSLNEGLRIARVCNGHSTWQSIESAPKDGTTFDIWIPDEDDGYRVADVYFSKRGLLLRGGAPVEIPRWPTHWMPSPTPPTLPTKGDSHGE